MTREANIKNQIKSVLFKYNVYSFMPVQMGYGAAGLDFHCIVLAHGRPFPFFIEAKKPGEGPRPRQEVLIRKLIEEYNCKVWVIDSEADVLALGSWLFSITTNITNKQVG